MSRIRSASCSRDPDSRRSDITGRLCSRCSTARLSCERDRKSTRLNSSHGYISYAVFCLKKMNRFGPFGGKFAPYSPCNVYSTTPPVIVDGDGENYGELTLNRVSARQVKIDGLNA